MNTGKISNPVGDHRTRLWYGILHQEIRITVLTSKCANRTPYQRDVPSAVFCCLVNGKKKVLLKIEQYVKRTCLLKSACYFSLKEAGGHESQ